MDNSEKVEILREWISKQPHLPQKNNVNLLRRFLHCSNDSIEIAKKLIDLFYTLRSQIPEIYSTRDPNSEQLQEVLKNMEFLPLPRLTKDNYQILLYRTLTDDLEKFDFVNACKVFSIISDVRMAEESNIAAGEVPIFDLKNYTAKHVTKIAFNVLKKFIIYSQEAHPVKLKQIHVINVPSFLDKFLTLLKPFVKSDILKMSHFHAPNTDTLFDYVPKELLPEEYGGTIGKCEDINKEWCDLMMKWRDYVLDDGYWKVDESKRRAESTYNASQYFGIPGSFKSLNID